MKLLFSLLFLASFLAKAQQIDWQKVNSSTIVSLLESKSIERNEAESSFSQLGNHNHAMILMNENSNVNVKHTGEYNTTIYNNASTNKAATIEVSSSGNNNIIDITGANSLSKEMKINIVGDNKTIFIRNY
ncbi:hypothetical protein [Chryseobacterium sp.]|uniref:hypothetical protein n=1 Tax=Chryseobacterium sp. TaxID=1871047 RepID=UPI00388DD8CF